MPRHLLLQRALRNWQLHTFMPRCTPLYLTLMQAPERRALQQYT